MVNIFCKLFKFLSIEIKVLLISALPIIELRGAIPIGISLGLTPIHATILSFIGSIIPAPFILFTIRPIFNYLKTTRTFKKIVNRLINKSINNRIWIEKYGYLGLLMFVAIPIPGTGVWSGSLAAAFLNMRFKYAFPAIVIGNLIAGIIIMILSHGFVSVIALR